MRRREVIMLLGGAPVWPLSVRAQQSGRVRRIVMLTSAPERAPEMQAAYPVFLQGLEQLGWSDGRNIRIERRSVAGGVERLREDVAELLALAPDIILASGTSVGPCSN